MTGKSLIPILAILAIAAPAAAPAAPPPFQDALLDRMTGAWVMRGTIEGKETTHDLTVQWVLGHLYLQIREVSREKDAAGKPAYEAVVFVGWDAKANDYACEWLDNTGGGGLTAQGIAHGTKSGDAIAFLFHGGDGSLFHTTFAYAAADGSWQWIMDGEANGKLEPFARLRVTRK